MREPGYAKVQIGIYITAVDDALGRNRLEKAARHKDHPSGGDGPGTGPTGNNGSEDPDGEDENNDDPKPKRKRTNGPGSGGNSKSTAETQDVSNNMCLHMQLYVESYSYVITPVVHVADTISRKTDALSHIWRLSLDSTSHVRPYCQSCEQS